MEAVVRKPYQGVANIIRFNWHFYVLAGISVLLLLIASGYLNDFLFWLSIVMAAGIVASTFISLLVSYYVYDQSRLYEFTWLQEFDNANVKMIVNVHAGFDETSNILKKNFPASELKVFDFYNPAKHTEVSIERARRAYPQYEGTVRITTSELPLAQESADIIFNIFALHEVRNRDERILFLNEQFKILRDNGQIVVVEHLRDLPNFLAYNIGFFHFLPGYEWKMNFERAGFCIDDEFKIAHFVTVYILRKA